MCKPDDWEDNTVSAAILSRTQFVQNKYTAHMQNQFSAAATQFAAALN